MIGKAFTVALIDDCPVTRYLCRKNFESQGITVLYEAGDGSDFLRQLEHKNRLPDGCLLDIDMPVMDGYETARWLDLCYPEVTILAYSSNAEPDVAGRMLQCGAHGFMAKGQRPAAYSEALMRLHAGSVNTRLRSPPAATHGLIIPAL